MNDIKKQFNPKELDIRSKYHLMISGISPRPIAFVTSICTNNNVNLAPYSFFNGFGANPPIVGFSPALSGRTGLPKDTLLNIKETKEHNMIVDMERSDLSRVCIPGTVKIEKQKTIEEYKDLFHYVSSIKGKLPKKIQNIDIIKAMMPGGSVIGCPKIRTLELLNKQEKEDRNIFTGSFGYIKFNKDMRFNIIIRSILNYKNFSEISAASGVVLDSAAKKEFNENYIKAKSLLELYKWSIW